MIFKGPWYVIKESWSFLTLQKSLCGKRLSRLRPSEHHPSKKAGSTCRLTTALMKQKSMLFSTTHLSVHVKSGLNSFIEITYIIYNKSSSHNFFSSWKTVSQKQHKLQSRFFFTLMSLMNSEWKYGHQVSWMKPSCTVWFLKQKIGKQHIYWGVWKKTQCTVLSLSLLYSSEALGDQRHQCSVNSTHKIQTCHPCL